MNRTLLQIIGVILILSFFTPFPGGTLAAAMGLTLLVCSNLTAALFVQKGRTRWKKLDNAMRWIEKKMGDKIIGGLRFTRPENDPCDHIKQAIPI